MDLRERIASLMSQVRPDLAELVAIRSVADPRQFPPEECARAARWVLDALAEVGFSDARLAEMADGSQAVLGTRPGRDPDAPTMLLYAHYDVQPPAYQAIAAAMHEAYGRPMVTLGEGGAIPLCNVLAATYPEAEL